MKLTVLTMVTKPDERQDLWREAVANYCRFADEVVIVNGGPKLEYPDEKVRFVDCPWPDEWDWEELPKHLNVGKACCTGEWILKLDIDQFIHEKEFEKLRKILSKVPETTELLSLTKLNFVHSMRYFSKNTQPILFRNRPHIGFGFVLDFPNGDLCMPMKLIEFGEDGVPIGEALPSENTDCYYWNFDYVFKTKEVTREHFARMARAYRKYYKNPVTLGSDDEGAWRSFINMHLDRFSKCKEQASLSEIPAEIREAIANLKPEQKGFNLWNETKV